MFLLGLLIGAGGAVWFILGDNGERLTRLGERARRAAALFRAWLNDSEAFRG